jgi:Na+/proline symporter
MSDRDRMDRMERKLNRIGRFVLFGIALLAIVLVVVTEQYYDALVFGYGNVVATTSIVVVLLYLLWARVPFRD